MSSTIKPQLISDMKSSMKSGDKQRLGVVRMMLAAIKQIEVDEKIRRVKEHYPKGGGCF